MPRCRPARRGPPGPRDRPPARAGPEDRRQVPRGASTEELLVKATNRASILDPFSPYINLRWNDGITNAAVLRTELQAPGWKGSIRRPAYRGAVPSRRRADPGSQDPATRTSPGRAAPAETRRVAHHPSRSSGRDQRRAPGPGPGPQPGLAATAARACATMTTSARDSDSTSGSPASAPTRYPRCTPANIEGPALAGESGRRRGPPRRAIAHVHPPRAGLDDLRADRASPLA